jgi:hypothetical protein
MGRAVARLFVVAHKRCYDADGKDGCHPGSAARQMPGPECGIFFMMILN